MCPGTVSTSRWALIWTLFLDSTPEFQHGAIARVWALKWAPVPDCTCFRLVPTLWDIEFRTTNYGKYSIGFKGAIIWNSLPLNIRNISSYNNRNSTELSKHVWTLKENNINYSIAWRILSSHLPYNSSSKRCNLCLKEKFLIICRPELSTLNKRNELVSSCRHRNKALLRNNWCNEPRTE